MWMSRSVWTGALLALGLLYVAPAGATPGYTDADYQLLWDEALDTFDGRAYRFQLKTFPTREAAEACTLACFLDAPRPGHVRARDNELPPAVRVQASLLTADELSAPFAYTPPDAGGQGPGWARLLLEAVEPDTFEGAVEPRAWVDQHAAQTLPSPDALRTEPALITRRVLNRVESAQALVRLLASGLVLPANLDQPLSNGMTPLLKAIRANDVVRVQTLLDRGAGVDTCTPAYCPLELSLLLNRPELAALLLARGADPNRVRPVNNALSPLAIAARVSPALVRLLLQHQADPNLPASALTPLMTASQVASRDSARLLLAAGADPLASRESHVAGVSFDRALLFHAPSEPRAYLDWLRAEIDKALAKTGRYDWSLTVEQGGRRYPVRDRAVITLKRQPFRFVARLNAASCGWRVLASEDPRLLTLSQDFGQLRQWLDMERVAPESGDASHLALSAVEDGVLTPVSQAWSADGSGDGQVREFVHPVTALQRDGLIPVEQYPGAGVYVVMGAAPYLGEGADLYRPVRFQLRFDK